MTLASVLGQSGVPLFPSFPSHLVEQETKELLLVCGVHSTPTKSRQIWPLGSLTVGNRGQAGGGNPLRPSALQVGLMGIRIFPLFSEAGSLAGLASLCEHVCAVLSTVGPGTG